MDILSIGFYFLLYNSLIDNTIIRDKLLLLSGYT